LQRPPLPCSGPPLPVGGAFAHGDGGEGYLIKRADLKVGPYVEAIGVRVKAGMR